MEHILAATNNYPNGGLAAAICGAGHNLGWAAARAQGVRGTEARRAGAGGE